MLRIVALSVQGFRDAFRPTLAESFGLFADSAHVEQVALENVASPRTAWRIGAPTSDQARRVDLHLVFFACKRVVGTSLIVGVERVLPKTWSTS